MDSVLSLIELSHKPAFIVGALSFYLFVSKGLVASIRDGLGIAKTSGPLKAFVLVHNIALAVFSLVVFLKATPLVLNEYSSRGWQSLHCRNAFWDDGFRFWANIFYLSKFYEFVDTWILVLKSKTPSFLQLYHHTGIAIAMYLGCKSEANWIIWPTVLNSFIHTLMYTYFTAATLGYRSPLAKILTTAQITQFVIGIAMSCTCYFHEGCINGDQLFSLAFTQVYCVGLIYLFYGLFKEKYKKSKDS